MVATKCRRKQCHVERHESHVEMTEMSDLMQPLGEGQGDEGGDGLGEGQGDEGGDGKRGRSSTAPLSRSAQHVK